MTQKEIDEKLNTFELKIMRRCILGSALGVMLFNIILATLYAIKDLVLSFGR